MDAIVRVVMPLLFTVGWVLSVLVLMMLIDVFTNRVTRFIGDKPWKAYLMVIFPPLLLAVFLPRYRVRRGTRQLIKPRPFVKV